MERSGAEEDPISRIAGKSEKRDDIEGIHAEPVERWFEANVEGARPPFEFELIAGGHSNLTYKLTDSGGRTFVLRRPPLGAVLESAHDMSREHKIVSALGPTDVPVAPVFGLCSDVSVNDAPFYVMGFVEGIVLHGSTVAETLPGKARWRIGLDTIDVLTRLHRLDPDAVGLGDLGRKEGYVARQLRRWSKQWANSKTRDVPEMEETHRLLEERMPEQIGASIVHGDYRLGNFLISDARIAAVLDWELCTLGDPLADVGYLLNSWAAPGENPPSGTDITPTAAGGFPSREELIERYRAATGRDLSGIAYYRAFSYWRSAAINEGVYARYLKGVMARSDVDLTRFDESSPRLARTALEQIETLRGG
jgi:aminoglycoside phosphotransferase (APT) family kinase protein